MLIHLCLSVHHLVVDCQYPFIHCEHRPAFSRYTPCISVQLIFPIFPLLPQGTCSGFYSPLSNPLSNPAVYRRLPSSIVSLSSVIRRLSREFRLISLHLAGATHLIPSHLLPVDEFSSCALLSRSQIRSVQSTLPRPLDISPFLSGDKILRCVHPNAFDMALKRHLVFLASSSLFLPAGPPFHAHVSPCWLHPVPSELIFLLALRLHGHATVVSPRFSVSLSVILPHPICWV